MITRGAPASMWAAAAAPSVKSPVDSITTSTPRSAQGRALGSRSENTEKVWSPTVMERSVWLTGDGQGAVRRVVLEEVGVGGGGHQVVDADDLHRRLPPDPACLRAARRKWRPIRPNPLIPTRTAIVGSFVFSVPTAAVQMPRGHYVSNRSTAASFVGSWPLPSGRPRSPGGTITSTGTPWSRTARRWSSVVNPAVSGGCGRRLHT